MKIHSISNEVINVSMDRHLIESERERLAVAEAVPGLAELRTARADLARYNQELGSAVRDELTGKQGVKVPCSPCRDHREVEALAKQFPVAESYLRAESWAYSNHVIKKSLGKEAIRRIITEKDHKKVIREMEDKWIEYFRNLVR